MLDYKKAHFLTSLKNTQVQYISAWHLYQYFDNQATKAKMVVHIGSVNLYLHGSYHHADGNIRWQ